MTYSISKLTIFVCLSMVLILPLSKAANKIIFLTPNFTNCVAIKCDGTLSKPYDSFFYALNHIQFVENNSYIFTFLGDSNDQHFIMEKEIHLSNEIYYDYTLQNNSYNQNYTNLSIEFKPFYCDDPDFTQEMISLGICTNKEITPQVNVNIRSSLLELYIQGNLTISHIHFD